MFNVSQDALAIPSITTMDYHCNGECKVTTCHKMVDGKCTIYCKFSKCELCKCTIGCNM